MQNANLEVLSRVLTWLQAGESCFLCTVVKTWGSSPRPPGSLLACNQSGQVVGSLSGGCVEDDLLERLMAGTLAREKPEYLQYGSGDQESLAVELPCGGVLYTIVEPMAPTAENIEQFTLLIRRITDRQAILRTLRVSSGAVKLTEAEQTLALEYDEKNPEEPVLKHWYGPRYQLFIIGSGMVSMYLADMAMKLDYSVIVCDPRPEFLAAWTVEGTQKTSLYPDDAIREYAKDPMTAVAALTHDPRIDDMGMMEALTTDAFYVGAMGSEKTSKNRRERLRELGVSDEQLEKLRAPVGLPIGSKTPPEIALSVLADITAVKNTREQMLSLSPEKVGER